MDWVHIIFSEASVLGRAFLDIILHACCGLVSETFSASSLLLLYLVARVSVVQIPSAISLGSRAVLRTTETVLGELLLGVRLIVILIITGHELLGLNRHCRGKKVFRMTEPIAKKALCYPSRAMSTLAPCNRKQ